MTGDGLLVDHAALARIGDELRGAVTGVEARLDRLEGDLGPLHTEWGGQAHDAYAVAKAAWDGAMLEMKAVLAETSRAVTEANAAYARADRTAAAGFQHR